jgi:predicted ABC-type ATPase
MEEFGGQEQHDRPKMVVLAGPNGSGKSTVTRGLKESGQFPDNYVNADDIAKTLEGPIADKATRDRYAAIIAPNMPDLPLAARVFLNGPRHGFDARFSQETIAGRLEAGETRDDLRNAYAAILADDQRKQSMRGGGDFAFETVMSTQGKLAMFDEAHSKGYDVDMVFVTTEHSSINRQRVLNRVQEGGHAVDPDKIVERYNRAMGMLPAALERVDTASVYDNSHKDPVLIAKKENGVITFPEVNMENPELQKAVRDFQGNLREKVENRQQDYAGLTENFADRTHKPIERSSVEQGSESYGRVVSITDHHVLQYDRENDKYVAHDRTLMTPGVMPSLQKAMEEGRDVTVAYNYGSDSKLTDQSKSLNQTMMSQRELDQYMFDPGSREEPKPKQM